MGIAAIAAALVVLFVAAVARCAPVYRWRAVGISAAWLAVFAAASLSGWLSRFDSRPPPMMFVFPAVLVGGVLLGRSRMLTDTVAAAPLWAVVLVQSFRFPLELVMHRLALDGIMPVEMSYSGYNFDIVTGITAIGVAIALRARESKRLAFAWNVLGSVLLAVIVTVALLASPAVRAFGEGTHVNTFVAHFPYVYLPTVCVVAALALHIALFRRLAVRG